MVLLGDRGYFATFLPVSSATCFGDGNSGIGASQRRCRAASLVSWVARLIALRDMWFPGCGVQ